MSKKIEKNILIINPNLGNLSSILNIFKISKNNNDIIKIADNDNLQNDLNYATHIILPGVGSFDKSMNYINSSSKLINDLKKELTIYKNKYFLAICIGMHILFEKGYEKIQNSNLNNSDKDFTEGLSILQGEVRKIKSNNNNIKIPHMGWNNINICDPKDMLFKDFKKEEENDFYFAHSYYVSCDSKYILADIDYGDVKIPAIVKKDKILACQFHPEKSGENGKLLIKNFLNQTN